MDNKENLKKIIIYGAMWCPDTLRALSFMNQNKIDFEFRDINEDEENTKFVNETNNGKTIIPTIIFPDGTILTEPSNSELLRITQK